MIKPMRDIHFAHLVKCYQEWNDRESFEKVITAITKKMDKIIVAVNKLEKK